MRKEYDGTREYYRFDTWDVIWMAFWTFILVVVVGMGYWLVLSWQNDARLKAQCLADGHKEYECVSMLRQNSNTFIMMTR